MSQLRHPPPFRRARAVVLLLALSLLLVAVPATADPPVDEDDAWQQAPVPTSRLQGGDRLATAAAIAQRSFPATADRVYLARADRFADALAGGTLEDGPILLVPSCGTVPDVVAAEIARLDPGEVVALGGEGAVCHQLLTDAADGRATARVAGDDRFATAVAIAQHRGDDADTVYLANADDSPDAVAGGILTGGPILLLPGDGSTRDVVVDEIGRLAPDRVVALGGTGVISDAQLAAHAGGLPTERLAGATRFATAVAIAQAQFPSSAPAVYLARGDVLADAVASGSLTDGPVLLVPQCGALPPETADYLAEVDTDEVVALGGVHAVCDELVADAAAVAAGVEPDPDPDPPAPAGPGVIYATWSGNSAYRYDLRVDDPVWEDDFFTGEVEFSDIARDTNEWVGTTQGAWIERNHVTFWDLDTQVENETLIWPDSGDDPERLIKFDGMAVSQDGQLVAGVVTEWLNDPHLEIVRRSDGAIVGRGFDTNLGVFEVTAMEWTPDGDLLVGTSVQESTTLDIYPAIARIPAEHIVGDTPYEEVAELMWVFTRPGMHAVAWLALSLDASELAFVERGNVYAVDYEAHAEPRQLTTGFYAGAGLDQPGWTAQFSPDGSQLALANQVAQQFIIPNHDGTPLNLELAENEDRYQVGSEIADRIIGWLP